MRIIGEKMAQGHLWKIAIAKGIIKERATEIIRGRRKEAHHKEKKMSNISSLIST